jgi:hypothetical protein
LEGLPSFALGNRTNLLGCNFVQIHSRLLLNQFKITAQTYFFFIGWGALFRTCPNLEHF